MIPVVVNEDFHLPGRWLEVQSEMLQFLSLNPEPVYLGLDHCV
jgi:hypothetical protein